MAKKRKLAKDQEEPESKKSGKESNEQSKDTASKELISDGTYKNKKRVLVFASRGVTSRHRHLMDDIRKMLPHHKKDVKLDSKGNLQAVNEIADVKSCGWVLFLEARKNQDLYIWLSRPPLGPSVKFHVTNVHTMEELRLTGNCMLGSRPLVCFGPALEEACREKPQWRLMKNMLTAIFSVPRGHPKSKPFVDRCVSFFLADNKLWMRHFQILDQTAPGTSAHKEVRLQKMGHDGLSLVEIGPRMVLEPIKIFQGSFGGPTLYENQAFVSPNHMRAAARRSKGLRFTDRQIAKQQRKEWQEKNTMPLDEMRDVFQG